MNKGKVYGERWGWIQVFNIHSFSVRWGQFASGEVVALRLENVRPPSSWDARKKIPFAVDFERLNSGTTCHITDGSEEKEERIKSVQVAAWGQTALYNYSERLFIFKFLIIFIVF